MARTPTPRRPRKPSAPGLKSLIRNIRSRTRTVGFRTYVRQLLLELCRVDTTPKADVALMRTAEDRCFRILEGELHRLNFAGAMLERRPINPAIQKHPAYSLLHFTKTPERPGGLTPEETYRDRANLAYLIPGKNHHAIGESIALNAHIDVVAPYFPPRIKSGTVLGRGACDDKGPMVSIVAALRILADFMGIESLGWNRNVLAMFVVEEETGGNGSLSLARDRRLKEQYDSVMVCECTGLKLHPANRGAVWYRAELAPIPGVSPLELFSFINQEMETEGASIRAESRHALFPQRPVQTCHGIIGPFGEHPSRICGKVDFTIVFSHRPSKAAADLVRDCLEAGLAKYVGRYGDKSKVVDPQTGKPMVARHFDVQSMANGFRVQVHGATGHMGAIRERDGAITKMAHLVRSIVFSKARLESIAGCPVRISLVESGASRSNAPAALVFEGGQGFVPTHSIEEVMTRLRQAAERGAEHYLRRIRRTESGAAAVKVSYEKLHNAAFDGDPGSPTMLRALAAAHMCGLMHNEPPLGWTVSCDARLFATEYPGMPVLTFGPGQLAYAHSDTEQIELKEIIQAAEFLALFLLAQTGTVYDI